jgi:phosphotriesterase-related protein
MVIDLTEGMDGTDIRAGVIGEIGTSASIHPDERKVLLAAAAAHRVVPAAIHVHTYPWARTGAEIVELLVEHGVQPDRIVIDHLDVDIDVAYLERLLALGVNLGFDCFGKEFQLTAADEAFAPAPFPTDDDRVDLLLRFIRDGVEDQLTMTNDLCFKSMLTTYGGGGYGHILASVVPALRARGVSEASLDTILVRNPARILAFAA